MEPAELSAISACQAGKLTEFGFLYERYVERVYKFLYFKTWHRETAEDLTSQTFMKVLERIGSYDPARGEFSSWLYRIAQNTFIDHYRQRKVTVDIDQVFNLASRENLAEAFASQEQLAKVEKYLKALQPEQRELVIMRLWQGMTYQEIAEVMGKSEAALKMAFSRTLRELRAQFPLVLPILWLLSHR